MNKKFSLSICVALAVAGCAVGTASSFDNRYEFVEDRMYRWYDKEKGVTCYIYRFTAISCIPDHQLMPAGEENQGYYDEERDIIQDKTVTRL